MKNMIETARRWYRLILMKDLEKALIALYVGFNYLRDIILDRGANTNGVIDFWFVYVII